MWTGALRRVAAGTADVIAETYHEWRADRTLRLGASLAYYGLFALVPLVSLAVLLASLIFSQSEVQSYVSEQLAETFGVEANRLSAEISAELADSGGRFGLGLFGAATLVVAGSFLFVALQDALNVIFGIPPRYGIADSVRRRFVSFAVVVLTGSLLVAVLAVQTVAGLIEALLPGDVPVLETLADLVGVATTGVLGTLLLAVLFRVLTSSVVRWRYALAGSALIALAMAVGAWALSIYFERFGVGSAAGAAGGLFAVLVFMYYEAQILLAGAELVKVAQRRALLGGMLTDESRHDS